MKRRRHLRRIQTVNARLRKRLAGADAGPLVTQGASVPPRRGASVGSGESREDR